MLRDGLQASVLKAVLLESLLLLLEQELRRDDSNETVPCRHVRSVLFGMIRRAALAMPLNSVLDFS